jgi:hypothetical protein
MAKRRNDAIFLLSRGQPGKDTYVESTTLMLQNSSTWAQYIASATLIGKYRIQASLFDMDIQGGKIAAWRVRSTKSHMNARGLSKPF